MGVPAFYRWLSQKFEKAVVYAKEEQPRVVDGTRIPVDLLQPNPNEYEFDNLYLDFNGIIHPCAHPEDRPAPATEEEMMVNIFRTVDRLFSIVRPRKMVYIAVDGVAPRAKMNQQRSRRFRTAAEAKEIAADKKRLREKFEKLGKPLPPSKDKKAWDSNAITPGTHFMAKAELWMEWYILQRLSTDSAWANVSVLLSSSSVPGEGEHKIMEFVRRQRAAPGYDPNTRHVICGLDADLIMLALATHEPFFAILREEVIFGRKDQERKKREREKAMEAAALQHEVEAAMIAGAKGSSGEISYKPDPSLKPYQFLHVHILRKYLAHVFRADAFKSQSCPLGLPFPHDLERIIDDFVFLVIFVGNDFLPHLPSLSIREGAIDMLIDLYRRQLPSLGGYLTTGVDGGVVLDRVDVLLADLGALDDMIFQRRRGHEENEKRRREERKQRNARERARRRGDHGGGGGFGQGQWSESTGVGANEKEAPPGTVAALKQKLERRRQAAAAGGRAVATGAFGAAAIAADAVAGPAVVALGKKRERGGLRKSQALVKKEENGNEARGTKRKREEEEGEGEGEAKVEVKVEGEDEDKKKGEETKEEEAEGKKEKEGEEEGEEEGEGGELAITAEEAEALWSEELKEMEKARTINDDVEDEVRLGEQGWKKRFYCSKFGDDDGMNDEFLNELFRNYVEGLCWVMRYYYCGCPSWTWYYPYHYAPFASDLVNMDRYMTVSKAKEGEGEGEAAAAADGKSAAMTSDSSVVIKFDKGKPFRPIEQLMAVLPPASAPCLPEPCRWLMTSDDSPVLDFYPENFEYDPNGKAVSWLWIVLLPFIDQARLLDAIRPCEAKFTEADYERNTTCPERIYSRVGTAMATAIEEAAQKAAREVKVLADTTASDDNNIEEITASLLKSPHENAKLEALARSVFVANSKKIAAALAAATGSGATVKGEAAEGTEDKNQGNDNNKKKKKKKKGKKGEHSPKCWLELQEIFWQSRFHTKAEIDTEKIAGAVTRYMREKPLGASVPLPTGWERLAAKLREGPDVGKIKDNRVRGAYFFHPERDAHRSTMLPGAEDPPFPEGIELTPSDLGKCDGQVRLRHGALNVVHLYKGQHGMPIGGHGGYGGGGGGGGKSDEICRNFQRGRCFRGNDCRYRHVAPGGGGPGAAAAGPGRPVFGRYGGHGSGGGGGGGAAYAPLGATGTRGWGSAQPVDRRHLLKRPRTAAYQPLGQPPQPSGSVTSRPPPTSFAQGQYSYNGRQQYQQQQSYQQQQQQQQQRQYYQSQPYGQAYAPPRGPPRGPPPGQYQMPYGSAPPPQRHQQQQQHAQYNSYRPSQPGGYQQQPQQQQYGQQYAPPPPAQAGRYQQHQPQAYQQARGAQVYGGGARDNANAAAASDLRAQLLKSLGR